MRWEKEKFSFPGDLVEILGDDEPITASGDVDTFIQNGINILQIPLIRGHLIFVEPGRSVYKRTLKFFGKEIEAEIELAAVFDTICKAGRAISSNLSLKPLLHKVMSLSEQILNVEVSAIILVDPEKDKLYWEISRGEKCEYFQREATLPLGQGIAGNVAMTGEAVVLNDVHEEPKWSPAFDAKSGFRTRSMICVPIKFHGRILGVIEVINKKKGKFTTADLKMLESIASQAGAAIENSLIYGELEKAYEELKALDKAREKVINHLAHEMRTPLAILSGVLGKVSRSIGDEQPKGLESAIERGRRNLERLIDLEQKVTDILDQKPVERLERMIEFVEDAICIIEHYKEIQDQGCRAVLEALSNFIRTLLRPEEIKMEKIELREFLDQICDEALSMSKHRDIELVREFMGKIVVRLDKQVLRKVFAGLLKNAIENTPDGGKIEISARLDEGGDASIKFVDYGVGITPENQKMIFGGFFHTQSTSMYSTKRPYDFGAGGTGADLLRTKIFSERFGFNISFASSRCKYIPNEWDACKGHISSCMFVKDREECLSSGGSVFTIRFPKTILT